MEHAVRVLFDRYQSVASNALAGEMDLETAADLYAAEFIAAAPAGVMAGKNDPEFLQTLARGFAHYRGIGTRQMQIREIKLSQIDQHHCVAHIGWTAVYERTGLARTAIEFEVHYLIQVMQGVAKVFGWISGTNSTS